MWFEFITNTNCNWECSYCAFPTIEDRCMSDETINRHQYVFDIIKKYSETTDCVIVVEGGEIGLIKSNNLLESLFKKFNQKVIINTNGKFFEQDRTQLYPYIDKVFYHAAQDAKTLFKVVPPNVPLEIVYGIVDDDNDAMEKFVNFNKHINIAYTGQEYSQIDEQQYIESKDEIEKCKTLNPFASIDLAREVLCMCTARGCHVTIPLTEENFIKVLTEYNNFEDNDMCKTCYRTCKSTPEHTIRERKQKFKDIISR